MQVGRGLDRARAEVPPSETGPVPVSMQRSEPRWFGVAPPQLLLAVAAIAFVVAIVLFATGHWPFGLILLGVAALLLAAFLEAAPAAARLAVTRASMTLASAHARRGRRWRARAARPRRRGASRAARS